jgi:diguanylate cyclase (GGDEF)-like protein
MKFPYGIFSRLTVRGLMLLFFIVVIGLWVGLRIYQKNNALELRSSINAMVGVSAEDNVEIEKLKKLIRKQNNNDEVFLAVSLVGILGLTGLVWAFLGAPLSQLARGMRLLSTQRWKYPLPLKGFGEISDLIRSFNHMAELVNHQKEVLTHEAETDELTGLLNFRAFQDRVQSEMARSRRSGKPVSLILADIDHFKRFNDTHGHLAGNDALKDVAAKLREGCREYDFVARFGGEELAVVMPETNHEDAVLLAERLRRLVSQGSFGLTVSCGVATFPKEAKDLKQLIETADERLYEAKSLGRNRVCA